MKYHYLDQDKNTHGPINKKELKKRFFDGKLTANSLVAEEGGEWATLESMQLFSLEEKTPINFKRLAWKIFKVPVALSLALVAIGGILYFAGVVDVGTFQSKQTKYESLIEGMRDSSGNVLAAMDKFVDGEISAESFAEEALKQRDRLKIIKAKFAKLGIPARDLQLELQERLRESRDGLAKSKIQENQNADIKQPEERELVISSYDQQLKVYLRIVEDYLMSDEDLEGKKNSSSKTSQQGSSSSQDSQPGGMQRSSADLSKYRANNRDRAWMEQFDDYFSIAYSRRGSANKLELLYGILTSSRMNGLSASPELTSVIVKLKSIEDGDSAEEVNKIVDQFLKIHSFYK